MPFSVLIFLALLLGVTPRPATAPLSQPDRRATNVLFITVDDMNGWGVMNHYPLARTPYFDKLKRQAYNFTQNVCASPVCVPSRAAFFSGVYPHKTGAYYNGGEFYDSTSLLATTEMIPECFKRNGYETFGRGKIFHAEVGKVREEKMFNNRPIFKGGFGPFAKGPGDFRTVRAWEGPDTDFPDVVNADAAIQFIRKPRSQGVAAQPFFCYVGFWRPHTPYTAPKRFFDLHQQSAVVMPSGYRADDLSDVPTQGRELVDSLKRFSTGTTAERHEAFREMLYGYLANTSFVDWSVGRVIEALDNSPHARNTIVIVASDNGYHMGEKERWQKGTLWQLSAYAPLLIRLPNGKAFSCPQTVNLIDLYPTLVELCGLNPPKHTLDGTSLVPIFEKPNRPWKPSLMTYGEGYSSVTDGRYRYIRYPDGSDELYDHTTDPYEWTNQAANPKLKAVKDRLAREIPTRWAKSRGGTTEKKKGA